MHDYLHAAGVNVSEDHLGIDRPEFRAMDADIKHGTFPISNNWVPIPSEYREPPRAGGGVVVLADRGHQALSQPGAVWCPRGAPASRH